MRDCPRICRYLHVPAQHGSDRILKLMNRGYTAQQYRDFIDRARGYMPDICIASDFIVGFPTETDEDFARRSSWCALPVQEQLHLQILPAARHDGDRSVRGRRARRRETPPQQRAAGGAAGSLRENNREMIGKTVEVMVEGESKLAPRRCRVRFFKSSFTVMTFITCIVAGCSNREKQQAEECQLTQNH